MNKSDSPKYDPDIIDQYYHNKQSPKTNLDNVSLWLIQPTNKIDVERISENSYKVSWSYAELMGNPHLIISHQGKGNKFSYIERGKIWYFIANWLIMPLLWAFVLLYKSTDIKHLLQVLALSCLFWHTFTYFMSRLYYQSIRKHVEKQIGPIQRQN